MKQLALTTLLSLFVVCLQAQPDISEFRTLKKVKTTSVKNQGYTNTCWSFATVSFIESEILRRKKINVNLSEMYIIRNVYMQKAMRFIEEGGSHKFTEGGLARDAFTTIDHFGLVPEEVYSGRCSEDATYNHKELYALFSGMLDGIVTLGNEPSTKCFSSLNSLLDNYIGNPISVFSYEDKSYSPIMFNLAYLDVASWDYIELTSFSHVPYYKKTILDIPDNWAGNEYFNVKIDDLVNTMIESLDKGMSVLWQGDVSETGFDHFSGVAYVSEDMKWESGENTQERRQKEFKAKTTTDDHLMHIIGTAKDKKGNLYFITKNSWGNTSNSIGGYIYLSEEYVRLKTIGITVHRNALTSEISRKLFL